MKYERLASHTVPGTSVYIVKKGTYTEEYVLVQYATYLCTKNDFRRIFATLRSDHFESLSSWGIYSKTIVDTSLRSS